MGGGVSLGTFSGAALTESIKLALLRGKDSDGNSYDDVEIDVFSGASAGSMALCIMFRALAHQNAEQLSRADEQLSAEYGDEYHNLGPNLQRKMQAAQVAQNMQEDIWVKEISMAGLLGHLENPALDLTFEPGILAREAVDKIGRKYFDFSDEFEDPNFKFGEKQLLGERVLFASTLANLSKITYDARQEFNRNPINRLGLKDGLTSNGHKELRVFDLHFKNITDLDSLQDNQHYPSRWCRFHLGPKSDGNIGALKNTRTWSKIIATSIACGAFPAAFEPVVLNRAKYEYGNELWPKALGERMYYPFTYVDGGTFNNEPIREAFRLAAYMDARDTRALERKIIFVDPNVSEEMADYSLPIHREFKLEEPNKVEILDKYDLIRLTTLDRLVPHVGSLLGAILNEARVIEKDKVFKVENRFKSRNNFRNILKHAAENTQPTDELLNDLKSTISNQLESSFMKRMIPVGGATLHQELERVIIETEGDQAPALLAQVAPFINSENPSALPLAKTWHKLLLFILLDLNMDLTGKDERAEIIALAPVLMKDGNYQIVDLPGRYVEGFGGFTSPRAGRHEVKVGKYCAQHFMEVQKAIKPQPGGQGEVPTFSAEEERKYKAELRRGLNDLANRLGAMIETTHLLNIAPGLDQGVLHFIANGVKKAINEIDLSDDPTHRFLFKIEIPDGRFQIDSRFRTSTDLKAQRINDKLFLITELDFHLAEDYDNQRRWSGVYLDIKSQVMDIDYDRRFNPVDADFCTIALPTLDQVKEALLMPNPIFQTSLALEDRGMAFGASRWKVDFGVTSLEDTLLA